SPETTEQGGRAYVAPRNATQETLCRVFAEVLAADRVGIDDNFFELGGHSLLAIMLIERLRREGFASEVRTLFAHPTPAALSEAPGSALRLEVPPNLIPAGCAAITPEMVTLANLARAEIDLIVAGVPGGAANVQDIYPLAPLQEGMLYHHLLAERGDPYQLRSVLSFTTRDRLDAFIATLERVIARHDVLRTAVVWEGLSEPMQVVWRKAPLRLEEVALDAREDAFESLQARFDPRRCRLDLRHAPLMRVAFAHDVTSDRWILVVVHHHLISDNTTLSAVVDEMEAALAGRGDEIVASPPFRDFVAQARLSTDRERQEAYFRAELGDVLEPTAPFGLLDVSGDGPETLEHALSLDASLARRLRGQARALGVSAASLFHTAFGLVVARACGRDDAVFGTVLFGRMHGGASADRAIGAFINTLPVRARLATQSVRDGVLGMHEALTRLLRHEHAPLALAQRCSGVAAPTPLFTALLNYRHKSIAAQREKGAAPVWSGIENLYVKDRSNYPVDLSVDDFGEGFELIAQAHPSVGSSRLCDLMLTALGGLVDALERAPQTPLRAIEILPQPERRLLLVEWNDTAASVPRDKCAHELFEAQAARSPDAIAVVHEEATLTYGELNARSNQLAHLLRERGVGPDVVVGLCVERSLEMIIALLGTLKAGGAYLPLDPSYPIERLAYMVEDARPALILTLDALRERAPATAATLRLDADWSQVASRSRSNLRSGATPLNLAYVIYTSGSTGKPKGVGVSHAGLVNLTLAQARKFEIGPDDRVLQIGSVSFDLAAEEIFPALSRGAVLVLGPQATRTSWPEFATFVAAKNITVLDLPTSFWLHFTLWLSESAIEAPACLRLICVGGEKATSEGTAAWRAVAPAGSRWLNTYGPTETTVTATAFEAESLRDYGSAPPIGRPISNTRAYLLDRAMRPVPIGAMGELYLGGAGVARGYLDRPDLTAARFVPDPFGEPGTRLYRTGDLARYRQDGNLEFLGRVDQQVKIRGFRIELGEIESALAQQEGVGEALVLAQEDAAGDKRLVAYVVPRRRDEHSSDTSSTPGDAATLRPALERVLPDYMVPSSYVMLDELPLTPSGKIDRGALPGPDVAAQSARDYIAPRNIVEWILAREFETTLGVERVGIHDSFFELGGNSLSGLKLADRIRRTVSSALPMSAVLQAPTAAKLAEWIAEDKNRANSPLVLMRPGADQPPLFVVHPAGGSIIRYRPLAAALSAPRPVWGFQSRRLFEATPKSVSMEEMVQDYVALMRERQPRGPYHVLGWSAGTLTALAMAAVIEQQGERLAFLGLVDPPPGAIAGSPAAAREQSEAMRESFALNCLESFARLQTVGGRKGRTLDLDALLGDAEREELKSASLRMSPRECFVWSALWGQERGFWSGVSAELMELLYAEHADTDRQLEGLVVQKIRAPVHVWRATETIGEDAGPTDWSAISEGEVSVSIVTNDHEGVIDDPIVHAQVSEALQRASTA
ncbi:MAG TPA: amino acid adenylation domain-containing protein, partial [Methylocystis sp.]|nr:amino acid adenylation domain-containing protein [Methylocystis sp.]